MTLNLYRRHKRVCESGHPEQYLSSEFEERKRGWKRCDCPIVIAGTLAKRFKRYSSGFWEWDDAIQLARQFEARGTWEIVPAVTPRAPEPATDDEKRISIADAVNHFLIELKETAAFATHKKYRLLLRRFEDFSLERGHLYIDQWAPLDVRQFRSTWPVSPQTAVRHMAMLKPFFEYCLSNNWVTSNPARAVKNPRGREVRADEQKLPFTDAEIKRMYQACERYGTGRHTWKGQDVADFISLSIYTGLRISDVAQFHVGRMNENGEIALRTTKAGTVVCTWVPDWLQERIRARAKKTGPHIFGTHKSTTIDVITEVWRRKLNNVWDLCGEWEHAPTPHRFRHTFARILLQKPGVTVRDVAELLGNTEDIVRKRYSAWIPERQARLTKILKDAFTDKPMPKLIVLSK